MHGVGWPIADNARLTHQGGAWCFVVDGEDEPEVTPLANGGFFFRRYVPAVAAAARHGYVVEAGGWLAKRDCTLRQDLPLRDVEVRRMLAAPTPSGPERNERQMELSLVA